MFRSKFALSLAAIAALATSTGAAFARGPESVSQEHGCEGVTMAQAIDRPVLSDYRIVSVSPYVAPGTPIIRTTWHELRGAVVRIEAQPGLTAQWLQLRVDRELVAIRNQPMADDASPFAVPGVSASVSPVADGFVITLAGAGSK